ncbi:hypothetical protein DY052_07425 [Apilactobacillus timberlakei]|uniref:hypothetical protein n=1 Tax=Apilactobacillus timberlakei TaxID=2008380 RepID=UPI00112C7090|nr:hypothetical protein [Apilactobacillus timberlakei]TPR13683.1 hypothetical protein DY052_07425 [Apilactobacillus timberlakei]
MNRKNGLIKLSLVFLLTIFMIGLQNIKSSANVMNVNIKTATSLKENNINMMLPYFNKNDLSNLELDISNLQKLKNTFIKTCNLNTDMSQEIVNNINKEYFYNFLK